jgi:hypothetical protein
MYRNSSTCPLLQPCACSEETQAVLLPAAAHVSGPQGSEVRADLVARVRAEIAGGRYETEERWHLALGRLLDSLE